MKLAYAFLLSQLTFYACDARRSAALGGARRRSANDQTNVSTSATSEASRSI
jgi:hypothetical protein